jgi:2,3-diphosphopglycerate-independent phosphoglycerate mutase
MKYIVILGDGMADEPLAELGGKTPLEYADTPNMDRMAREGSCGLLNTIPDGFEAGSDIANMSILGYAPQEYYTGRGPLEALSMGVDLAAGDVAYRCNLVTVENGIMMDFSAGHISSGEGASLLASLNRELPGITFQAGVSYRNLVARVHELLPRMILWASRLRDTCRMAAMRISSCAALKRAAKFLPVTRSMQDELKRENPRQPRSGRGAEATNRRFPRSA